MNRLEMIQVHTCGAEYKSTYNVCMGCGKPLKNRIYLFFYFLYKGYYSSLQYLVTR